MSDLDPQAQPAWQGPTPPDQPPATAVAGEDRPERIPFWHWLDVLVLIVIFAASFIALGLAAAVALQFSRRQVPQMELGVVVQFIAFIVSMVCLRLMFRVRYSRPLLSSLGWRFDLWYLVPGFVTGMLVAVGVVLITAALHTVPIKNDLEKIMRDPVFGPVLAILGITLAPFFEEMFFRGLLQPLLVRTLGVYAGVAISASLFALPHGPQYHWAWQYLVAVFLAGLSFAAVKQRTGSTFSSFLMHSGYNFMFFAGYFLFQRGSF